MGIYDRDYYRESPPMLSVRAPRTAVGVIVLVNVVVYLIDVLLTGEKYWLSDLLAVHGPGGQWPQQWPETLTHPWLWWQFLTYGFAHSPRDFSHILFNMMGLWFLGPPVEMRYGTKEFVRLYLATLVVGSLAWAVLDRVAGGAVVVDLLGNRVPTELFGASGAITGVVILFALNFPRQMLLLFFVLPVPAWVVGVLLVVYNVFGATGSVGAGNVAYTVHLAGAAFAFLYYQQQWNLGRLAPGRFSWPRFSPRRRLRVYDDEDEAASDSHDAELAEVVDRILAKIHREGESSLTRKERRTLEDASREYQKRRHD